MIITRTPLRISLVGGGTDMPAFYEKHTGAVISFAINKYVYISVNKKFDGKMRVSYSKTENVDSASQIEHDIVRKTMAYFGIQSGYEIVSVADIPGEGTGLGSSSSFTVGLLNAFYPFESNKHLAEAAFYIESEMCGHPVGKQDQYAAAFGGLNYMEFYRDDVSVTNLAVPHGLAENLLLLYTGKTRSSNGILEQQSKRLERESIAAAKYMARIAQEMYLHILNGGHKSVGEYLHENWMLKKKLASGISDDWIDSLYKTALNYGATGGKICGAGGGGFLLLYAPKDAHENIEKKLGMKSMKFEIELEGSTRIYE